MKKNLESSVPKGAFRSIFHIAADFPNQDIYPQLIGAVANGYDVFQTVVSAVRTPDEARWIAPMFAGVRYEIHHVLKPYHRLFFRRKVKLITGIVEALDNWATASLIHAHCLYSDGAVARRLNQRTGIPYITAIRNVDINAFMRLRPDLDLVRNDVLRNARAVVCISPAYKKALLLSLPTDLASLVEKKILIIPNGIARFWRANPPPISKRAAGGLRVLYVGDFSRNKNITGLLSALRILAAERTVSATIVGGTFEQAKAAGISVPREFPVAFCGRVTNKTDLLGIYREHDVFAMPSFTETFGVAYIEALSQGLPIVHSAGQGVDGFFTGTGVAEAVDPKSPASIAEGIRRVASKIPEISGYCVSATEPFDWGVISEAYTRVYESALR